MEWLQNLVFVIGLGGLLGGLLTSVWASRSRGLQELLKTENEAYKESNQRLHEENNELRAANAQCTAELKVWKDNVTQRPKIEELIAITTKQHGQYMTEIGKVTAGISELTAVMMEQLKEDRRGK